MGFWHTGYQEFHELTGLETWAPAPPTYHCAHCEAPFDCAEDVRIHRFASHPLRRPSLFVRGRELGTRPLRITQPLAAGDIRIDGCEQASLNGTEISVAALPR